MNFPKMRPDYCQERVAADGYYTNQCGNKPKRDGYCERHHPDKVAARNAVRKAETDARIARSMWRSRAQELLMAIAMTALDGGNTAPACDAYRRHLAAKPKEEEPS